MTFIRIIPPTMTDFTDASISLGDVPKWLLGDIDTLRLVVDRYAEPQRHYHTLPHIEAMLSRAHKWFSFFMKKPSTDMWLVRESTEWQSFVTAIVFHDVIYDPRATDNEEQSALFAALVIPAGTPSVDIPYVCRMIEATKSHRSNDPLTQYLIDLDMGILATPTKTYDEYARAIRREYRHVSLEQYVEGRTAFLSKTLLDHRGIFYGIEHRPPTYAFQLHNDKLMQDYASTFSNQIARDNIAREIGWLTACPKEYLEEPEGSLL